MPRGDKASYSSKQQRKAEHIEEGYEKRGVGEKEAERRAWATVNKDDGGGKKSGSGRGKRTSHAASQARARAAHRSTAKRSVKRGTATRTGAKRPTAKRPTGAKRAGRSRPR